MLGSAKEYDQLFRALCFYVLADNGQRRAAAGRGEVARGPEMLPPPHFCFEGWEVSAEDAGRHTFEAVYQLRELHRWGGYSIKR